MRRIAKFLPAASVTVLMLVAASSPMAMAGEDIAGAGDDVIWVHPQAPGQNGTTGGGGDTVPCDYLAIPEDPESQDTTQGVKTINGIQHFLFYQDCLDGLPIGPVWVPELTPRDLLPAIQDLLESRLHYPTPLIEPVDPEFGWLYVQVPTDFRVDQSEWLLVEAYAEVSNPIGTVWVRATADPTTLILESGDNAGNLESSQCGGAAPVAPYVSEMPGECSFTFVNASSTAPNGTTFPGAMSIIWEASWVSSDPDEFGDLVVGPTVTPIDIAVAEAKSLVICTGAAQGQGSC